jgi:hypothetical protein
MLSKLRSGKCFETTEGLLLKHQFRAADSLQLAAAVNWAGNRPEGFEFVCLDKRLREATQAEGFTVLPAQLAFDALIS